MDSNLVYVLAQLIIIFGILNVWLVRFNKKTNYRGSDANSLKAEFKAYGYPDWFFYCIGFFKLLFAFTMIAGFWIENFTTIGSLGVIFLMLGAIVSHLKVKDTLIKFLPASIMVLLSIFTFVVSISA